jgi:AhpD family alkylhydroperoxidase
MAARLQWKEFAALVPDVNSSLLSLSKIISESGLDLRLIELVKLRASQINTCAFCIQFHVNAAIKLGIASDKIRTLATWQIASQFSERECAALKWTELLTVIGSNESKLTDAYSEISGFFSDAEVAYLTAAIALISAWNRIAIAYQFSPPPPAKSSMEAPA